MKQHFVWLLPALALLLASTATVRADQFTDIQNSPYTYWVPAPRAYVGAPPPPYYYGPPPGTVVIVPPPPPTFFLHFHFH